MIESPQDALCRCAGAVGMAGACKQQSAQVFEAVQGFLGNCGGH